MNEDLQMDPNDAEELRSAIRNEVLISHVDDLMRVLRHSLIEATGDLTSQVSVAYCVELNGQDKKVLDEYGRTCCRKPEDFAQLMREWKT